jgi:hypothetical protein
MTHAPPRDQPTTGRATVSYDQPGNFHRPPEPAEPLPKRTPGAALAEYRRLTAPFPSGTSGTEPSTR